MASAQNPIQTGYWVDHTKGVVLGGTLTYKSNAGAQLISAATLLVQLMGASIWVIVSFGLHQRAVTRGLQDEYDAQKQVLLRNSGSATGDILKLYNMGRTWHGHMPNAWRRSLVHMILPFVIFVGFTIAGIYVGQIAENPYNSRVLLSPVSCGSFVYADSTSVDNSVRLGQLFNNITQISDAYARNCYSQTGANDVQCGAYASPRIAYEVDKNASCPLGPGNCNLGDNAAISMKALEIDSHNVLGINAKAADRLSFKYNATCAPVSLQLQDRLTNRNASSGLRDNSSNFTTLQYQIGQDLVNNFTAPYEYSQSLKEYGGIALRYSLNTYQSYHPHTDSGFVPASPFNLTYGDIVIAVIAPNGIAYTAPNRDPIFSTTNATLAGDSRFYVSDHFFRTLFCSQSYSICKDGGSKCTQWAPLLDLIDLVEELGLNAVQNATWNRLGIVLQNSNIAAATRIQNALRASDQLIGPATSPGLPDNQWAIEVEAWFQATLAQMQYIAQSFAVFPKSFVDQARAAGIIIQPPDTTELNDQCYSQRIQTPPGYTSYNVFALVFIFVLAVILISSAIFVSQFGHKLPGRHPGGKNYHKLTAYQADGMLQLQRMALEGAGFGGWRSGRGSKKDVPFTKHGKSRVPPPIVETKIKARQVVNGDAADDDDSWEDGLLYYEKANLPEDDHEGTYPTRI